MFKQITPLLVAVVISYLLPQSSIAEHKHLFLNNHPRLRKTMKAAGIGVVTGGLAAPLLGHLMAGGAVLGAGKGAAVHSWRERRKQKRIDSRGY